MSLTRINTALNQRSVVSKTTTYTATILDDVILCDASGGAFTVTLPSASSVSGKELFIKKTDSSTNAITLDGNGSETIDSNLTFIIPRQHNYVKIVSNGSNWIVIDDGSPVIVFGAGNAGQTITVSTTPIPFTEVVDTHNAYDGATLTAPKNGHVTISGNTRYNANVDSFIALYINGSRVADYGVGTGTNGYDMISFGYPVSVGDTIALRMEGAGTTLSNPTPPAKHHTISMIIR